MIKELVEVYDHNREAIAEKVRHLGQEANYFDLVKVLIEVLAEDMEAGYSFIDRPDPERITEIDYGDYQGTVLFVIAAAGYQPSVYYSVMVWYGSCSGCDTLQSLQSFWYDEDDPEYPGKLEEMHQGYETLIMHMFQSMALIGGDE